jgi:hypothetical protein
MIHGIRESYWTVFLVIEEISRRLGGFIAPTMKYHHVALKLSNPQLFADRTKDLLKPPRPHAY